MLNRWFLNYQTLLLTGTLDEWKANHLGYFNEYEYIFNNNSSLVMHDAMKNSDCISSCLTHIALVAILLHA